jgi:hypothetical protein
VAEIDRLDFERQLGRHVIVGAAAATDGGLWLLRRVEHFDARKALLDAARDRSLRRR